MNSLIEWAHHGAQDALLDHPFPRRSDKVVAVRDPNPRPVVASIPATASALVRSTPYRTAWERVVEESILRPW